MIPVSVSGERVGDDSKSGAFLPLIFLMHSIARRVRSMDPRSGGPGEEG